MTDMDNSMAKTPRSIGLIRIAAAGACFAMAACGAGGHQGESEPADMNAAIPANWKTVQLNALSLRVPSEAVIKGLDAKFDDFPTYSVKLPNLQMSFDYQPLMTVQEALAADAERRTVDGRIAARTEVSLSAAQQAQSIRYIISPSATAERITSGKDYGPTVQISCTKASCDVAEQIIASVTFSSGSRTDQPPPLGMVPKGAQAQGEPPPKMTPPRE